jgi:hypothetical protein
MVRQCRRLFLDQAIVCRLRARTYLDGHAAYVMAVQDEHTYDETLKERAYYESTSSLPW